METNPQPPEHEAHRKLSQDERDGLLFQLLETSRSDMVRSVTSRAEMLAMRAAILKLAEGSGLDRQKFDEWMAAVLDERKENQI